MKKNHLTRFFVPLFLSLLFCLPSHAQEGKYERVNNQEVVSLIDSIAKAVEKYYISAEMGKSMGDFIRKKQEQGAYNNLSYDSLAKSLRKDFVSVSGDVHMSAFYRKRTETPKEDRLTNKLSDYGERSNFGHTELKISKDNLGYLKISHFTNYPFFSRAKAAVDNSLKMLQHTDALLIDLRNNGGGFEEIVAYLVSYFVKGETGLLQEYYCRFQDSRRNIRISEELPGKRLLDIPVYILINKHTGSAAESFAYLMKHLKRATVIGETSVGAGNGSNYFRISDRFMLQVATWETINQVTKTSWEKTGVVPHIETSSEEAYDKARELAEVAAKKYKEQRNETYSSILDELDHAVAGEENAVRDEEIVHSLEKAHAYGLIDEGGINSLGYEFLIQKGQGKTAEAIFKANTLFYPSSANVFDSYGEALAANGNLETSLQNYEIAVKIAQKNGDADVNIYIENRDKIKKQLEDQ